MGGGGGVCGRSVGVRLFVVGRVGERACLCISVCACVCGCARAYVCNLKLCHRRRDQRIFVSQPIHLLQLRGRLGLRLGLGLRAR